MKKIIPGALIFIGILFVFLVTAYFIIDSAAFYARYWPAHMHWKAYALAAIVDLGGIAMAICYVIVKKKLIPGILLLCTIGLVVFSSSAGQVNPILSGDKMKAEYDMIIENLKRTIDENTENLKNANKKDRTNINLFKRRRNDAREDIKYYQLKRMNAKNRHHDRISVLGLIAVRAIEYPLIVCLLHFIASFIKNNYFGYVELPASRKKSKKSNVVKLPGSNHVAGFTGKIPDSYEEQVVAVYREEGSYAAICRFFGKTPGGNQNNKYKEILKRKGVI